MPADAAPACIVVTGIQGCGKTTMVNAFLESLLPDSARDPRALEATTTTTTDAVLETCRLEGPPRARGSPAARVAGFAPSHEQISAQERDALVADPRGRAAAARVARQRWGVLPVGLATRVTTRVVAAPRHAAFAARVSVTYAAEAEIHSLLQRARLAHGQSRGPPLRVDDEEDEAQDPESSAESSTKSSSSGAPRAAPAATASLTTRDLGRVAAVLGVRPSDVPTALRDGSKPYLPTRFVALLGRTRVCEFFATKRTERPAKRKRGRPRKNEEREKNDGWETTADLTPAVVAAVRAYLCRVAHGDWSRWGLIAGDVVVELPMTTKAGIEMAVCDVPGAPRTGSPWRNTHSRAHLVRALASAPLDALVSVCDGGPGPSRELRGALRESGCLDRMVSDERGGVLVLAWPLDKIASHDPSVTLDPDTYAAMQTKLAERGQGSDAGDDDSASDHSDRHRNAHDEDDDDSDDSDDVDSGLDSGTARRSRLLSRGGADESWTRCLARAAGRNGGVVRGAMSSQPVHTFFGAVELEAPTSGLKPVPKRRRAFRDSFASLAGYLVERAGDALEKRRRPRDEGDEDEGGDDESRRRAAKAAVIAVARGDGTGIDDDAVTPSRPRASPPPPPLPPPPPATAASRLTAREPLRDVSAELGKNAERSLKPPVLKPQRGAPGAQRTGPLEAAARRAGGIAAGRGAEASERRVRFTSSVLGGTSADDGAEEVGKSVPVAKDEGASNVGQKYRSGGNRPRDLFSGDAPVVPWWERKL